MKKKVMVNEILIENCEIKVGEMLGDTMLHDIFGHADVVKGVFTREIWIAGIEFKTAEKGKDNYKYDREGDGSFNKTN